MAEFAISENRPVMKMDPITVQQIEEFFRTRDIPIKQASFRLLHHEWTCSLSFRSKQVALFYP